MKIWVWLDDSELEDLKEGQVCLRYPGPFTPADQIFQLEISPEDLQAPSNDAFLEGIMGRAVQAAEEQGVVLSEKLRTLV